MRDPWSIWLDCFKKELQPHLSADATLTTQPGTVLQLHTAIRDNGATTEIDRRRHVITRVTSGGNRERDQLLIVPYPSDPDRYDMWLWVDSERRSRRWGFSGWERILGTEVRHMDLVPLVPDQQRYDAAYLRDESIDGEDCELIEIRWKDPSSVPNKQRMWIAKSDHLQRRAEQYSGTDLLRIITFSGYGASSMPNRREMWSVQKSDDLYSRFEFTAIDPNTPIDDDVFDVANLGDTNW